MQRNDWQSVRFGLAGGGAVDWAMSHFLRAGNSLVVTGFWRSGTTFLLEQLTQLWRAKRKKNISRTHIRLSRAHTLALDTRAHTRILDAPTILHHT